MSVPTRALLGLLVAAAAPLVVPEQERAPSSIAAPNGAARAQSTGAAERLFLTAASPAAARAWRVIATADRAAVAPRPCAGDCNGDARVSVEELITGVGAALGRNDGRGCLASFCNADCGAGPVIGRPTVACLVSAVDALLNGCPLDPCGTDADCDDGNPCSRDTCTAAGCASTCLCV